MLSDEIRKRMTEATKARRNVERDILRLAMGELQITEARAAAPLPEEEQQKVIRKLIKSNSETLGLSTKEDVKARLAEEIAILESLLPKRLDLDAIVAALAPVAEQIKSAKSDGQATGVAMKHLKSTDAQVDGKDVGAAIKKMRGA